MAFPNAPGLTPPEIAFICEMELVTIVPRQRLERLDLLGVSGPAPGLCTTERWGAPKQLYMPLLILHSSGSHSSTHPTPTISAAFMVSPPAEAPETGEHYTPTMVTP
jgi:hypothetical protein